MLAVRLLIAITLFAVATGLSQACVTVPASRPTDDQLDQLVEEAKARYSAPGISVAIAAGGRIIWSKTAGLADVENAIKIGPDTALRIGSVSKMITAIAILQLVEKQKIALDVPIEAYLPEYAKAKARKITVRQLLSHTSGMRHYMYELGEKENTKHFASLTAGLSIYGVDEAPLMFEPGSAFLYSTFGYNLLGAIIETVSGSSYGDYVAKHVLIPARARHTVLDEPDAHVGAHARQYRLTQEGKLMRAPYVDSSFKWSAGGWLSTAEDLLLIHFALEQGKLLKPSSMLLAATPAKLKNGESTQYGFGWWITHDEHGHNWISHGGSAIGGRAYLLRSLENSVAVAIGCNIEKAPELKELAIRLANIVLVGAQHENATAYGTKRI